MFAEKRYETIMKIIEMNGCVTVKELTQKYDISTETVRRDLLYLEKAGKLKRVHGGAVELSKMKNYSIRTERLSENQDKKEHLSIVAVGFLQDHDIIAIDCGSTAFEFAKVLNETKKHLTVVTHSLDVFNVLKSNKYFNVILIGGQFSKDEEAFYGKLATDTIEQLHFKKAFIFPSGISLDSGITDFNPELSEIQKAYIKKSDSIIIAADSSKFQQSAFIHLMDIDEKCIIVTDNNLSEKTIKLYKKNKINLYV